MNMPYLGGLYLWVSPNKSDPASDELLFEQLLVTINLILD